MQQSLPKRLKILIGVIAVSATALLTWVVFSQPADAPGEPRIDVWLALGFGLLIFLAEQFPVRLPLGEGSISVSFVLMSAAIIVGGPAEVGIAAAFGFLTVRGARKVSLPRHLFNAAELSLASTLAGLTYEALLTEPIDRAGDMFSGGFPPVLLPVLGATAVQFLVNTGLVAMVVAILRGGRVRNVWRAQFTNLLRGYVAFAVLGVILAALYLEMGAASVIFLLVPLLVARNAFQSAVEMETAYEATVRSMIKAIEAKDPYTKGHAERVAKLSEMTARAYGLSAEQCRVIRYIALMHDVGKLGVSTKILAKPGKLTDEEYEHMKQHPIRGYEIVSEIDFLKQAAETAVRHHHERMDGRGYPDGLVGENIPVIARIVMVCDAFDSMTSTRVYRKAKGIEDALAELHRCVGTQFDPVSLAALEKALAREGWEAEPEPREEEEVTPGAAAIAL
ncbi:MAG: HD-GYP domain-containing protein [Actinomycetota bacterium]